MQCSPVQEVEDCPLLGGGRMSAVGRAGVEGRPVRLPVGGVSHRYGFPEGCMVGGAATHPPSARRSMLLPCILTCTQRDARMPEVRGANLCQWQTVGAPNPRSSLNVGSSTSTTARSEMPPVITNTPPSGHSRYQPRTSASVGLLFWNSAHDT